MNTIDYKKLSGNPTLLTLLRAGCKITLPDGSYLSGDPETLYIDTGNEFGSTGLRSLDHEGVRLALNDLRYDRKQIELA